MEFENYLKENGFREKAIECCCPHCVTVSDFICSHKTGAYILICQDRIVPVLDGVYFEAEESGEEIVLYYYEGAK